LQDSARAEAFKVAVPASAQASSDDYRPGGMRPGYFWAAIGLMAGGAGAFASAALLSTDCPVISGLEIDCRGFSKAYAIAGAGLVGTGLVVFLLGKKEAAARPQISWTPHGVAVRNTFKF
jgi:hypothetical protein